MKREENKRPLTFMVATFSFRCSSLKVRLYAVSEERAIKMARNKIGCPRFSFEAICEKYGLGAWRLGRAIGRAQLKDYMPKSKISLGVMSRILQMSRSCW